MSMEEGPVDGASGSSAAHGTPLDEEFYQQGTPPLSTQRKQPGKIVKAMGAFADFVTPTPAPPRYNEDAGYLAMPEEQGSPSSGNKAVAGLAALSNLITPKSKPAVVPRDYSPKGGVVGVMGGVSDLITPSAASKPTPLLGADQPAGYYPSAIAAYGSSVQTPLTPSASESYQAEATPHEAGTRKQRPGSRGTGWGSAT